MSNKNILSLLASIAGLSLIKRKTTGSSALKPDKYVDIDFYFVGKCTIYRAVDESLHNLITTQKIEGFSHITKEARESFIKQMDTSIFDILLYASQHWRYRGYNRLSSMHPLPSNEAYETFQIVESLEFPAIAHLLDYWVWEFEDQYEPLADMEETDAFGGYNDESLFETLESLSTIFISFDSYKLEINEDYALSEEHEDHFANGYFIQYVPFKLKCRFLLNQDPNDIAEAMTYFLTQVVRMGFSDDIDAEIDVDVGYKQVIDPNNKLSEFSKSLIFGKPSELRKF